MCYANTKEMATMDEKTIIVIGTWVLAAIMAFLLWFFFYGIDIIKRLLRRLR